MPEGPSSRVAFLRERVAAARAAGGPTSAVPFRQEQIDLPKIQLPISFPLYRLQNGRTHRAQAAYIEQHDLAPDFFEDPEADEAQEAQGEILVGMIDQADLRQDLEEREQRSPLVLTYDGFIVDGNRRTAALREEGKVEQLTAVVLPEDADASDLYETELELQMARETKAEYNWVDEALHVRWGIRELNEPMGAIARRMGTGEREVEDLLGRLSLVDLYLDWLGAPGKYHRVPTGDRSDAEQSFRDLHDRERRPRFKTLPELQQRAIRHACFSIIKERGGYADVRRVADGLINRPREMIRGLREELPEELSARLDEPITVAGAPSAAGGATVLDELAELDESTAVPDGAQVLNLIGDATNTAPVAIALSSVAEDLDQRDKEAKEQGQPLRKVERALRNLQDVSLTTGTPRLDDIASVLAQLTERTDELAQQIEDLKG